MKKMGILFLLTFISPSLYALTCFEKGAGLLAAVLRDSDQLIFSFSASRGYESIPQVQGPVSHQNMPLAKYQIESLKSLGNGFEIRIPVKNCNLERASEGIFSCSAQGNVAGTDLAFGSLYGFKSRESHVSGEFETQNFRLMVSKEDTFFFHMPFGADHCTGTL